MTNISVENVIIGGGIQGLTLLHQCIMNKQTAVLFTKDSVGDGETLHGHEYINTGYFGNSPAMMNRAIAYNQRFEKFIGEELNVNKCPFPSYFVTLPASSSGHPLSSSNVVNMWKNVGHEELKPLQDMEIPDLFRGEGGVIGSGYNLFKTTDYVVESIEVVKSLFNKYRDYIKQGELVAVQLDEDGSVVTNITVKTPEDGDLKVNCGRLLLATGAWTTRLLYNTIMCDNEESKARFLQSIHLKLKVAQVPMICLKGEQLPAITFVGAVLKNKMLSAGINYNGESKGMWKSTPLPFKMQLLDETEPFNPDEDPQIESSQVQQAFRAFAELFPTTFNSLLNDLEFGVYYGWKAEHPSDESLPKAFYVDTFGTTNLAMVIPSVWPNVIAAAEKALSDTTHRPLESTSDCHDLEGLKPATLGELKYKKIEWLNWQQLQGRYNLPHSNL